MNLIHNGTTTSILAAAHAQETAALKRQRILGAIVAAGPAGLTREEVETTTGIPGNTVRPRVRELIAAGSIHEAGATRATRSGEAAKVLTAVAR